MKREILAKKGREKQVQTLKQGNESPVLSNIDKTEKHNTQKEIAKSLNWSTGKTARCHVLHRQE